MHGLFVEFEGFGGAEVDGDWTVEAQIVCQQFGRQDLNEFHEFWKRISLNM